MNMKSDLFSLQPGVQRRASWPEGPVHDLARQIGIRSHRRLSIQNALRLADALGTFSYGKTMAAWEAEKGSKKD